MENRDSPLAESYQQAHQAILSNPYWFSDEPQLLDDRFSAAKRRRAKLIIYIRLGTGMLYGAGGGAHKP